MKYNTISILGLFAFGSFLTSSCADALDDETTSQSFEVSRSGRWRPPTSIEQSAKSVRVKRVGAGRWRGRRSCSPTKTYTPAMLNLKKFLDTTYPQISSTGGYSCRHIVGNSKATSVHATGRALDIHIPLYRRRADNDKGDPIANYLLANAQEMGIQTIIWDESIWTSSRARQGVRYYTGSHRHRDHLHIEITPNGPSTFKKKVCDDIIKESGGILDNTSNCFETFGNQRYWRRENVGYEGALLWTNATKSSAAQNWARWNINFEKAGKYKVFYHSTKAFAKFDSTKYKVKSGKKTSEITIDQSAGQDGWEELGTFDFVKGKNQWVTVGDNSDGPVARNQHIVADAIKIMPDKGNGEVRITLEWTAGSDYDIHVRTPSGNVISGDLDGNIAADGGRLIKDSCYAGLCKGETAPASLPHQEVVAWAADTYPVGEYLVWVVNFDGEAAGDFKIIFTYPDGKVEERTGSIAQQKGGISRVFSFDVNN